MPCLGLNENIRRNYEIREWRHACTILQNDFPEQWKDIEECLDNFTLPESHITARGGGLGPISSYFNRGFKDRGWVEKKFDTAIEIDSQRRESPTHKVDCVKGRVALEIEWNNKDPFYDRDLNNFRLLFDLGAVSVGVIITKSDDLREIFEKLGKNVWEKYGTSTTWMSKLEPRIEGGGGGGCPILVFGITKTLYKPEM